MQLSCNILLVHSFQTLTSDMNQPEWCLDQAIFLGHIKAFTGGSGEEFQFGTAELKLYILQKVWLSPTQARISIIKAKAGNEHLYSDLRYDYHLCLLLQMYMDVYGTKMQSCLAT